MITLKSNNSNDEINFEVNKDIVNLQITYIENSLELTRLVKYFVKYNSDNLNSKQIQIKLNNYQVPEGWALKINREVLPKKDNYKYSLTLQNDDFYTFFVYNIGHIPYRSYDNKWEHDDENWEPFLTNNKANCIKYEFLAYEYGVLFYLDFYNRPNDLIKLIEDSLVTIKKRTIKPIRVYLEKYQIPPGMNVYQYEDKKKLIINTKDFVDFFKYNIRQFLEKANLQYNDFQPESDNEDDDGWTTTKNKRSNKRSSNLNERKQIEQEIVEIEKTLINLNIESELV